MRWYKWYRWYGWDTLVRWYSQAGLESLYPVTG